MARRPDADGTVDFDKTYEYLIKETIEPLDIECVRCDEIDKASWIHRKTLSPSLKSTS